MKTAIKALIITFILSACGVSWAETRYVTDQFKITLRSGESSSHKILRMLPSGTTVEVLNTNPETGYSHVRTRNGQDGYVLSRQLLAEPVARDKLITLKQQILSLRRAPNELTKQVNILKEELTELQSKHQKLQQDKQTIEQELVSLQRTSANAVRIANERNSLRKTVAELTQKNSELTLQNHELGNDSLRNWFLVGAGVLAMGILMGLVLPNIRMRKRKNSWDSSL